MFKCEILKENMVITSVIKVSVDKVLNNQNIRMSQNGLLQAITSSFHILQALVHVFN